MSPFDPTPDEEALFDELSDEHIEWIEQALDRAPEPMVSAIVCAAACGSAVAIGIPKETFLREMGAAFDTEVARRVHEGLEKEQTN